MPLDKLDLMVLKTLSLEPLHGYGIGRRIEQMSGGALHMTMGALYPALQRLERSALVKASWSTSDNNRRARYYTLTPAGRRRLASGQKAYEESVAAVMRVLRTDVE